MLTEEQLLSIVDQKITDAQKYDDETQKDDREKASEYYRGEMKGMEPEEGRSKARSQDVADAIDWIMPDLMEIFCGSSEIVEAVPSSDADEELAKQQADGTNHVFMKECNGYWIIHDLCHDTLLHRNAIAKYWRDTKPVQVIEEYEGLDADTFTFLDAQENVEFLEHTEREDGTHDLRVKVTKASGSTKVRVVPRENFLIDSEATSIEDTPFAGDIEYVSRSDLRERLKDDRKALAKLEKLTANGTVETDGDESREEGFTSDANKEANDRSMDLIEVFECYFRVDLDQDGIAEWVQVLVSGVAGSRVLLSLNEWDDDLPYADTVSNRVPHRFSGRSISDKTMDIQEIKTALLRGALDNIYWQNNPEREVVVSQMDDDAIDLLNDRQFGNSIPTKAPGSVSYLSMPYFADNTFGAMAQMDRVSEGRTGVSATSKGLDPDTLQNQTAEAVRDTRSNSRSMARMYARNMAEGGIKRLMKGIMRLTAKYEDQEKIFKLRGKWTKVDPRVWDLELDLTVNVGLGSGSKEQDVAILQMIYNEQKQLVLEFGPDNPICPIPKLLETFSKLVEAAGLRNPEIYFNQVSEEDLKQWLAQQQEGQEGGDQARLAELQLKAKQHQDEIALKQEQMKLELALKRDQMLMEMQLKREQMAFGSEMSGFSTEVNMGGEPG